MRAYAGPEFVDRHKTKIEENPGLALEYIGRLKIDLIHSHPQAVSSYVELQF